MEEQDFQTFVIFFRSGKTARVEANELDLMSKRLRLRFARGGDSWLNPDGVDAIIPLSALPDGEDGEGAE